MFSEVNHLSGKQTLEAVLANAFTANSTVTNCPLSPDVSALICFAPLMIFEDHYTVVTPTTSRLYSNYHLLGMHDNQSLHMAYQTLFREINSGRQSSPAADLTTQLGLGGKFTLNFFSTLVSMLTSFLLRQPVGLIHVISHHQKVSNYFFLFTLN